MYFDEAFVKEVRANPQDNMARMILADYLDDSGNPLAEFIRVQVQLDELAENVSDTDEKLRLEKRERELLESYGEAWLEPLRKLGVQGVSFRCFSRGLVERIKISVDDFLENGEEIVKISPGLSVLQFRDVLQAELPGAIEFPKQIRTLDFSSCGLGGSLQVAVFYTLLAQIRIQEKDSGLNNIERLVLDFNRLSDSDFVYIGPLLGENLRAISVGVNQISTNGVEEILNAADRSLLEDLNLSSNEIYASECHSIAMSQNLPRLQRLSLASNSIHDEGAIALCQATNLPELKVLNLRSCGLTQAIAGAINESVLVRNLELLDLRNNSPLLLHQLSPEVQAKLGAA